MIDLSEYVPALKYGANIDAPQDVSVVDDLTVNDDLTVSGLATVGETLAVTGVVTCASDNYVRGNFYVAQGAPTAETGAATITAADLISGIITITHTTGSTVALTVDTGTAMDTALPSAAAGDAFDWYVINLSAALADTATVTAAAGHTLVGEGVVESAHADSEFQSSAHFRSRRTAANTWITYRLS